MQLTQAQQLMWLGQKLHPKSPLYNMVFTYRLDGEIDVDLFHKAFSSLVSASDNLRTVIHETEGAPEQIVLNSLAFEIDFIDLSSEANPQIAYDSWLDKRRTHLFEMDERLFDSVLLKLGAAEYVWYFSQHHIVTDAWSCQLIYRHMSDLYQQARDGHTVTLPSLVPYADYVAYEQETRNSERGRKAADYWAKQLDRSVDPVQFYAGDTGATSIRTTRKRVPVSAMQRTKLRELVQRAPFRSFSPELSYANLLTALMWAFLYRISGNDVIRLGMPLANRANAQQKETMGLLLEVLSSTCDLESSDSLETLVKKAASENLRTLQHLQPGVGTAEHNRAYDVLLNFITVKFGDFAGLPTEVSWVHSGYGDENHKLRVQVHDLNDTGNFDFYFDFNTATFSDVEQQYAIDHFLRVLDACLHDPQSSVGAIPLLSETEQQTFLVDFNATDAGYPANKSVLDLFEEQVAATPDATAVQLNDKSLTYAELNRRANQLAQKLIDCGVTSESIVPVFMDHSFELVIAVLAVIKAGGAYVPFDTNYPDSRITQLLDNLGQVPLILTQPPYADKFDKHNVLAVSSDALSDEDTPTPARDASPDHLAYVMFTSGTTGEPKGVMVEHKNLLNYVWWAKRQYSPDEPQTFALYSSFAFDLTVTSLFVPLISGGSIRLYPEQGQRGTVIRDVFTEDAVDVVKLTPSHLALVQDLIPSNSRIKTLIVGGEDFKTQLARQVHLAAGGRMAQFNEYGPTEATVACMLHKFNPQDDTRASVPIGTPSDNMRVYVLDKHLQPVPTGMIGELYLSGVNVARGYFNRPELTEERFIIGPTGERLYRTGDRARWLSSGQLEFLGRNDGQVKVGGARIELREVEAALFSHPQVTSAIALVRDVQQTGQTQAEEQIRHCQRCGISSNYPGISFDENDICSICSQYETYKDKAAQYFSDMQELTALVTEIKSQSQGDYDCLVLLSGGKDSSYMLYQLVGMGLRVLSFTLDNGYISEDAKSNIRRMANTLGVDHVFGETPFMNEIFVDSLRRYANVCNGCFKTIYTLAVNLARQKGIKTIITGLSRGQFFETRLTEEVFSDDHFDTRALDESIAQARQAYHQRDDVISRSLDVDVFRADGGFQDIRFIDFYRYCDVDLDEMYRVLEEHTPWLHPTDTGRSTNCLINDVGIYVHNKRRGFHNYALPYSWDVRMGHKTREQAIHELNDDLDEARIHKIMREIGYNDPLPDEQSQQRLVAYYVADGDLNTNDMRDYVSSRLPDWMVPTYFLPLDRMPLTANGKINTSALPAVTDGRMQVASAYVAPETDIETTLTGIWEDILHIDSIGVHDNFFDLGGHSLPAIRIVSRIEAAFAVELPLNVFFANPTVANLALAIEEIMLEDIEQLSDAEIQQLLDEDG